MEEVRQRALLKCPFCSCGFITKVDLEKHLKAFGNVKEQHLEEYRRCHGRAEYSHEE